jgi:opacity protein-like surface antigen
MKKQILFALLCLLLLQCSYAQKEDNRDLVSFSAGASFPTGNFSSSNPSNKLAGYAKAGIAINFSFEHPLNRTIGLAAMLSGEKNGLNTAAFARQFQTTGIYFDFNTPRHYPDWVVEKKSWYRESLLAGITQQFPIAKNNKLSFGIRELIGAVYVQSPKLYASSSTDTAFAILTQSSAAAFGFCYLLGAGIKYTCTKNMVLLFNADYSGATPVSFKNVKESAATTNGGLNIPGVYLLANSRQPVSASSFTGTEKQPFGSINIRAGIGIKW